MAVERQDGALAGLLLAPLDRGVIYAGKLASNLVLMLAVAAVITPVGMLFFHFDLSAALWRFSRDDGAEHGGIRSGGNAVRGGGQFDAFAGGSAGDGGVPDYAAAGGYVHKYDGQVVSVGALQSMARRLLFCWRST